MSHFAMKLVGTAIPKIWSRNVLGCRAFIACVTLAVFAAVSLGDEDTVRARIGAAKDTYAKAAQRLREPVLKSLKKAAESARRAGNKTLVDKIKEETDAFESKGVPPTVVATKEYQRQLRKAAEDLENVFIQSIKAITKAGLDDEAETVEKELNEFRTTARVLNGKHYRIVRDPKTWHEAQTASEKQGGHLAIVVSEAENRFLTTLLKAEGIQIAYIGATDERKEGLWLWIDGTELTYSNWDRQHNQPNNNNGRGSRENYAGIYADYEGKWWDLPDPQPTDLRTGFIYQWD